MGKSSQPQKIVEFLQANPLRKFTARQIAQAITEQYPHDYQNKKSKFADGKAFIQQVVSEIGSHKGAVLKLCPAIRMQDKPRPRLFWFDPSHQQDNGLVVDESAYAASEQDLYPLMMCFLSSNLGLYGLRIDEKRSKNNRGSRGNHWLHPDIVAMQALDKAWQNDVRQCAQLGAGQHVLLWSFE